MSEHVGEPYVADTRAVSLPREGEWLVDQADHARVVADLHTMDGWLTDAQREIDRLRAELALRDETIAKLSEANGRQCDTIMEQTRTIASLRAELADTGEGIGDAFGEDASDEEEALVKTLPTANMTPISRKWLGEIAEAIGKVAKSYKNGNYSAIAVSGLVDLWDESYDLDEEGNEADEMEEMASMVNIPSVVAMAAAHDKVVNGATERLLKLAAEAQCSHCGTYVSSENLTCGECGRWLGKQTAMPSPSPRDTAEDERVAILERVAKEAKAYREDQGCDAFKPGRGLDLALAELDKAEATQCPSR